MVAPPQMVFGVELSDADAEPRGTLFEDTRDNRRYPGQGERDVAGFITSMRRLGWEGSRGVEMLSRPSIGACPWERDCSGRDTQR
ncbi:hypothetical protein GCM10027449_15670 [Sinomonas notoginsengisoli]